MSVRNAKEKGLLYRKCTEKKKKKKKKKKERERESEVRVQRVNETFVVAEWRQEGGSGQGSTGTRSSTRRGEKETSERLVRMCAVPFQRVPEWCQRTNCVNTPYGTTCRVFLFLWYSNASFRSYGHPGKRHGGSRWRAGTI